MVLHSDYEHPLGDPENHRPIEMLDGSAPIIAYPAATTESPTPTPLNTAVNSPSPSQWPSPRPSPGSSPKTSHEKVVIHSRGFTNGGDIAVPRMVKYRYLAMYFALNLGLTLFNKGLMLQFPYPFILSSVHAACSFLGCHVLLRRGHFHLGKTTFDAVSRIWRFSLLYTLNIAMSNLSLNYVTIPFHQVVRATTPVYTILLYRFYYKQDCSTATYVSLVLVVIGVCFATYGDYYFTWLGFFFSLSGAVLASLKTVVTNQMLTGKLHFSALEMLYRTSSYALVQSLIYACLFGELAWFGRDFVFGGHLTLGTVLLLLFNGLLSFALNVVSFTTNQKTGALTMTVAANVKQILTIVLGIGFFNLNVGVWDALGIALTLLGGAMYAHLELKEVQQEQKQSLLAMRKCLDLLQQRRCGRRASSHGEEALLRHQSVVEKS